MKKKIILLSSARNHLMYPWQQLQADKSQASKKKESKTEDNNVVSFVFHLTSPDFQCLFSTLPLRFSSSFSLLQIRTDLNWTVKLLKRSNIASTEAFPTFWMSMSDPLFLDGSPMTTAVVMIIMSMHCFSVMYMVEMTNYLLVLVGYG